MLLVCLLVVSAFTDASEDMTPGIILAALMELLIELTVIMRLLGVK